MKHVAHLAVLIALLVTALLATLPPAIGQGEVSVIGQLNANPSTIYLVRGYNVAGKTITYSGTLNVVGVGGNVTWCEVKAEGVTTGIGISTKVTSSNCNAIGRTETGTLVRVAITVALDGVYVGGSETFNGVKSATLNLYGGSRYYEYLIASVQVPVGPVSVNEVRFENATLTSFSTAGYTATTRIMLGTAVVSFAPYGNAEVELKLTGSPTFPDSVNVTYTAVAQNLSLYNATVTVDLKPGTSTYKVALNRVFAEGGSIQFGIARGNNTIHLLSVQKDGLKSATVSVSPYAKNESGKVTIVSFVTVNLAGGAGNVNVAASAGGTSVAKTYTTNGTFSDLVLTLNTVPQAIDYTVGFERVNTSFRLNVTAISGISSTGGLVKWAFILSFYFILVSGFGAFLFGLLTKQPGIQSAGLVMVASSVLVFLAPTLMGMVAKMMIDTGAVKAPPGFEGYLSGLSITNIGDAVDTAIRMTVDRANGIADNMISYSTQGIGILVAAIVGGIALAVGLGLASFGAAGNFLANTAGPFIMMIMSGFIANIMGGFALKAVASVYASLLPVIVAVMLFYVIASSLLSVFTGNYHAAMSGVVQMSVTVFMILLTPCIVETLWKVTEDTTGFEIPGIGSRVTNPFAYIPVMALIVGMLVGVLFFAFNRLMSMMSS